MNLDPDKVEPLLPYPPLEITAWSEGNTYGSNQYVNATTSATSANSDTLQWGELYGFPRSDGPEAHYEPFQKIRSDQLDLGKGSSGFYLEEPHPRSNTHALEDDYQTRFNPGSDAPNTLPENNVRTTMSMSQGDGSVFLQSNWFRNGLFTPSQIQESYSQATVSRPNADTRHLYSQMNGNTYEVNKIPKPRDSSAGAFAAALPHRVALSMARNLSGTITSFPTAFGRMGGACDIEISQERKHCLKCGADNRTRPPERVTFAESACAVCSPDKRTHKHHPYLNQGSHGSQRSTKTQTNWDTLRSRPPSLRTVHSSSRKALAPSHGQIPRTSSSVMPNIYPNRREMHPSGWSSDITPSLSGFPHTTNGFPFASEGGSGSGSGELTYSESRGSASERGRLAGANNQPLVQATLMRLASLWPALWPSTEELAQDIDKGMNENTLNAATDQDAGNTNQRYRTTATVTLDLAQQSKTQQAMHRVKQGSIDIETTDGLFNPSGKATQLEDSESDDCYSVPPLTNPRLHVHPKRHSSGNDPDRMLGEQPSYHTLSPKSSSRWSLTGPPNQRSSDTQALYHPTTGPSNSHCDFHYPKELAQSPSTSHVSQREIPLIQILQGRSPLHSNSLSMFEYAQPEGSNQNSSLDGNHATHSRNDSSLGTTATERNLSGTLQSPLQTEQPSYDGLCGSSMLGVRPTHARLRKGRPKRRRLFDLDQDFDGSDSHSDPGSSDDRRLQSVYERDVAIKEMIVEAENYIIGSDDQLLQSIYERDVTIMEMIIEAKNHIIGSLIRQLQSVHISLPPMDLPDLSSYSSTTARRTPASHHDDPNLKPAENKVFEQNAEAQQGIDETTPQDTTTRVQKRGGSSDEHHSGSMQDFPDDAIGPAGQTDLSPRYMLHVHPSTDAMIPEIITSGLISVAEVDQLFTIYFQRLNLHTTLLDPVLHTSKRTFGRSPFLFVVVCAISSRYNTERPELYCIAMHFARKAAASSLVGNEKSIEICQAYMLLSVYPMQSRTWNEAHESVYLALATHMATDLGLHTRTDTIIRDEHHEREVLNRTRTWLRLYCIDRSASIHLGKPAIITPDRIIRGYNTQGGRLVSWWKSSMLNHPFDLHLFIYTDLLSSIITGFQERVFWNPETKTTGLRNDLDLIKVAIEHDEKLQAWNSKSTATFSRHCDPLNSDCAYQKLLLPLYMNYFRLVVLSLGFQQTIMNTMSEIEIDLARRCLNAACGIIEVVVDKLAATDYFRYAPNEYFAISSFAAAFIIKVIGTKHAAFLDTEETPNLIRLVGRLIIILKSPRVALDTRHTPIIYSRFLESLLANYNWKHVSAIPEILVGSTREGIHHD